MAEGGKVFEVYEISDLFHYTVWVLLTLGLTALVVCLNRWQRASAFVSGAAAASAFFSYLLLQVGLGDIYITWWLSAISGISGAVSLYLYHRKHY